VWKMRLHLAKFVTRSEVFGGSTWQKGFKDISSKL
jgi:hypothetical protein